MVKEIEGCENKVPFKRQSALKTVSALFSSLHEWMVATQLCTIYCLQASRCATPDKMKTFTVNTAHMLGSKCAAGFKIPCISAVTIPPCAFRSLD